MVLHDIPAWKEAPFLRILIPAVAGMIFQFYFPIPPLLSVAIVIISLMLMIVLLCTPVNIIFRTYWLHGIFLNSILFFLSALLLHTKHPGNIKSAIINYYKQDAWVVLTIDDPLSEKKASYKTTGLLQQLVYNDSSFHISGRILIYFSKTCPINHTQYGQRIAFRKPLQLVRNTGNPGSFDFRNYCLFQNIYYQVYLTENDFIILPERRENVFVKLILTIREKILGILRLNIPGKKESALAEALLIGYKDDLDKNLVQSYSNTGVVHVIAISGLHVGLVYCILSLLLKPLKKYRKTRWINPVSIISGLWLFSILAGSSPSVLRSAVMFTCIVIGESVSRKISVINSLATSAFLLLCYHPFWIRDVGFQLSYAAVLGIVLFMKPIYNLLFIKNKILDAIWKLQAVTLAAQVFTIPLTLFYFHQFPVFFLYANLVAVPLSSAILVGEIILCTCSFIPYAARIIGTVLQWSISFMNRFIEHIDRISFSTISGIQINTMQVLSIYLLICSITFWMKYKKKRYLFTSLLFVGFLFGFHTINILITGNQVKMIVYNIPKHEAIDFLIGRNCIFRGDDISTTNNDLYKMFISPGRVMHRVSNVNLSLNNNKPVIFEINHFRIAVIDKPIIKPVLPDRIKVDVIILSKNQGMSIAGLMDLFDCKMIVLDNSNSFYKLSQWKKECIRLGISCHAVVDKGAFVMNLN